MTTQIPEQLSEQEARKLIDQNTPRFNALRDEHVRIKTRAEEGQKLANELLDKAAEKLGTRDVGEINRILQERRMQNAQRVSTWLLGIETCEKEIKAVTSASPSR